MAQQTKSVGVPVGAFRDARITKYNLGTGKAKVKLANVAESLTSGPDIEIYIPNAFYSDDGLYVGGLVKENTPIVISRGEGGTWNFVSFSMTNASLAPTLIPNQLLIQSTPSSQITLDTSNHIYLGSQTDRLHLYTNPKNINDTLYSSTFDNNFSFTEGSRTSIGLVKRETSNLGVSDSVKLKSDDFFNRLSIISLDPTASKAPSFINQVKNPSFVEQRNLVYEFGYSYNVQDDITESNFYTKQGVTSANTVNNTDRRQSRADTLSLSLVAPNYLMETVQGTVIDIFGNILDINRNPIPIGSVNLTIKPNNSGVVPVDAFNNIKAAERKSLAYHFEINARKDLQSSSGGSSIINLLDLSSNADYARTRSRFFFDIDKEGQFKLNVPASSETGNVTLLTRYENYSTFGPEENGNPDKLIFRQDNLDIFLDSFAIDEIAIQDGYASATPLDRITGSHIMKGMPFHSVTGSLSAYQSPAAATLLGFEYNPVAGLLQIPTLTNVVSPTINISGTTANAGGRSGTLHFDGSLEFSMGANTVDRQSLWLDTAGGIIGNIGRDMNNVSMGLSLDGDLLVQVGGVGISSDSRFSTINNAFRGGAVDIRVLNEGGTATIIRVDKNGVTIASPTSVTIKGRDVTIAAEGNLLLQGDNVAINERAVLRYPQVSI